MAALQGFQGHFWRPRLFLTGKLCQWASHFMPEECRQAEGQPCFLWGIYCWWSQPNRLKDHSKPMAMCSSISILTQKVFPKGVPSTIKHYMWITFLVSLLGPLFPHISILRPIIAIYILRLCQIYRPKDNTRCSSSLAWMPQPHFWFQRWWFGHSGRGWSQQRWWQDWQYWSWWGGECGQANHQEGVYTTSILGLCGWLSRPHSIGLYPHCRLCWKAFSDDAVSHSCLSLGCLGWCCKSTSTITDRDGGRCSEWASPGVAEGNSNTACARDTWHQGLGQDNWIVQIPFFVYLNLSTFYTISLIFWYKCLSQNIRNATSSMKVHATMSTNFTGPIILPHFDILSLSYLHKKHTKLFL